MLAQLLDQHAAKLRQVARHVLGADEFINDLDRWCLWLVDAPPALLRSSSLVEGRLKAVRAYRSASKRDRTRQRAARPRFFGEIRQPDARYVLIPRHSSERREFVPMGYLDPDVICGDAKMCVPTATLLHFGILTSSMHNAWVRAVCGRLKSDFRYSAAIVYNNFPWPFCQQDSAPNQPPESVDQAPAAIESAAQGVLDVRAQFPGSSLADLYDPLTMPPALLKAHQRLDAAVDKAYQLAGGPGATPTTPSAWLFCSRSTSASPACCRPRARQADEARACASRRRRRDGVARQRGARASARAAAASRTPGRCRLAARRGLFARRLGRSGAGRSGHGGRGLAARRTQHGVGAGQPDAQQRVLLQPGIASARHSMSSRCCSAREAPMAVSTFFTSSGGGSTAGMPSDLIHSSRHQPVVW